MAGLMESIGSSAAVQSLSSYAAPITSVAGGLMKFVGARDAGRSAKAGAEFEAGQLEQNAGQQQAAGQRRARDERRRGRLVASAAQARAAMSGGALDPTVVNLISDIDAEAMYRSQLALYGGDDRARSMRMAAAGRRFTGDATQRAYKTAGRQALIQGASIFTKYGGAIPIAGPGLSDDDWGMEY